MTTFYAENPVKLLALESVFPDEPVDTACLLDSLKKHCTDPALPRRARAVAHRLGIKKRHLSRDLNMPLGQVRDNCDAPSLCLEALRRSSTFAKRDLHDIEYLIGHTTSPHTLLPPNIAWVADRVNFQSPYMELRQACTGFANALQIASAMVAANSMQYVGIVGSEVGSPFFTADNEFADIEQLVNYVQMGDGAAAALIGPAEGDQRSMLSDLFIGHIGNGKVPGLSLSGGGSKDPYCDAGLPVFEHQSDEVRKSGPQLFEKGLAAVRARGYKLSDFRYIIPHQANGRLALPLAQRLKIDPDRIYSTAHKYGNLGSVAIWAALADLRNADLLAPGDKVLILGAEATKYIYGGFVYTH
ncbi:MAG: 3-oxoacyl-[acyl-carrier-protein] synthase III C-terminal domain-containing protein [Pseudomonadota bacterium]